MREFWGLLRVSEEFHESLKGLNLPQGGLQVVRVSGTRRGSEGPIYETEKDSETDWKHDFTQFAYIIFFNNFHNPWTLSFFFPGHLNNLDLDMNIMRMIDNLKDSGLKGLYTTRSGGFLRSVQWVLLFLN